MSAHLAPLLFRARATFVEHRQRRYCVADSDLRIPELALGSLDLDRLPAVLAGEMPASPAHHGSDPSDFVDDQGRRWTSERVDGSLDAWTQWRQGRPLLWWKRRAPGGVLSHLDGAQFRWRRSVVEPLAGRPPELEVPAGYLRAGCDELSPIPESE